MANTIKLKRASGSDPSASDLSVGELAIRTSNCKLFSRNDGGSAVGIVAGSADTLTTARTIAGVSFDGSANISLNNNAITNGAGFITDVVSDTTPQLGGDLDMNSKFISSGILGVKNTGSQSEVRLYCEVSNAHYVAVKAPPHAQFSGNPVFQLPPNGGTNGYFLKTNGSGVTSWAAVETNLVDDTTPQLGGDLDVQSNKITTATSNGNVKIEPNGSGVVEVRGAGGNDGKLQLNCSAQSHGIKLASPAHSAGQSYTLIFPDNQIAADKYLKIKSISGSGSTAIGQAEYASLDANDLGEGTVPDARFPSTLPALNGSALTDLNGSNIASGTIAAARVATLNQDTTGSSASCTGNAATATALANARTIAGVSFDGTSNISLNNNAITNGAGYITNSVTSDLTITSTDDGSSAAPELELYRNSSSPADGDYLGQLKFTGESDDGSKEVYAKITGKISDASSGTEDGIIEVAHRKAGSNVITARFTSTAFKLINGTELEAEGGATVTGNIAVTGTVDGRDIATDGTKLDGIESGATADQSKSDIDALGIAASTAATLATARNIGGVSFNGSANIDLPGVNSSGNQDTSGNAATATALETARTIAGVSFDGSANISLNNNAITNGAGYITSADGGNAATLDSLDSTSFLRADAADSGTGLLTLSGGLALSGQVGAAITAASDGSTITLDLGANTHQSVTLGGNRTFAAPSNQTVGQSGSIFITQDGTGSRTASFNSAFKFVGGTAPTLSTAANAVDRIDYVIKSSNVIHCAISLDVK